MAEVLLQTQNAEPYNHWRGPWPGGLDPYATDLLQRLQRLWGEPGAAQGLQKSYFVDGSHGAAWVVNLEWINVQNRLRHLRVFHMGSYLPFPAA